MPGKSKRGGAVSRDRALPEEIPARDLVLPERLGVCACRRRTRAVRSTQHDTLRCLHVSVAAVFHRNVRPTVVLTSILSPLTAPALIRRQLDVHALSQAAPPRGRPERLAQTLPLSLQDTQPQAGEA